MFEVARWALEDVYNRMDVFEEGGELTFSYEFNLLKKKHIQKFNEGWIKQELNYKSVRDVLTCVLLSGMDDMMDGFDIILPSLNNGNAIVFMNSEAKSIIKNWKKASTYISKVEKIVEPYVSKFVEKFQKQLSKQKLTKNRN